MIVDTTETRANKIYNDIEVNLAMIFLHYTSNGYPPVRTYASILAPVVEAMDATFVKMTDKPFGFWFAVNGYIYEIGLTKEVYSMRRHVEQSAKSSN